MVNSDPLTSRHTHETGTALGRYFTVRRELVRNVRLPAASVTYSGVLYTPRRRQTTTVVYGLSYLLTFHIHVQATEWCQVEEWEVDAWP